MNIGDLGPWQNRETYQPASADEINNLEAWTECFADQAECSVVRHGGVMDKDSDALAFFSEYWQHNNPQAACISMALVRPSNNEILLSQAFDNKNLPKAPTCKSRRAALVAVGVANLLLEKSEIDRQGTELIAYMRDVAIDLAAGDTPELTDTMPSGSAYKNRLIADVARNVVGSMVTSHIYTRKNHWVMNENELCISSCNVVKPRRTEILRDTAMLQVLFRSGSLGQTFRYFKTLKGQRTSASQLNTDPGASELMKELPEIKAPAKYHVNVITQGFKDVARQEDADKFAA